MPGPAPTPPHLKAIAGTSRADRDQAAADIPQFPSIERGQFPEAPQHLTADGAAMWNTLGPELVNCGILQVVDLYALEQTCYAWQRFRTIAKAGSDFSASEHQALRALFSEFGMTPVARRRVVNAATGGKSGNKFARHAKRA
jgi:phage terminase small subunit